MTKVIINNATCINNGYCHDDIVCQNQSKWMSRLDDNKLLSSISIPGTHDTMSLGWGGDIVQNQSIRLKNQLASGIRFLDIRLAAYPNSTDLLYAHHEFVYLHSTFSQILDTITVFLKSNPSEGILLRLRQEYTKQSDETFLSLLERFTNDPKYSNYIYSYTGDTNPRLKQFRGKIVILQSFGGLVKWIHYSSNFNIQDSYNLNSNWDLYSKWEKVKAQLNSANLSSISGYANAFINYLSGSGGAFPYFVASGHSSPGTNAPQLVTGLTEPAFKNYYPDFPRINRFGIFATIAFEGTNELTKAYINARKLSYVGIIAADFPGQGLINSVINVNFN